MRYAILLAPLAAITLSLGVATADGGSTPPAQGQAAAPRAAAAPARSAPARTYQSGQTGRRGWFSGRSAKNWNLNRGTPDDNSTIPTPVNRNPKGRPKNSPVFFPKNM